MAAGALIENGADTNALSNQGKNPLHLAALNDNTTLIKLLIDESSIPSNFEQPDE
jgi:ankyrin repeat protein